MILLRPPFLWLLVCHAITTVEDPRPERWRCHPPPKAQQGSTPHAEQCEGGPYVGRFRGDTAQPKPPQEVPHGAEVPPFQAGHGRAERAMAGVCTRVKRHTKLFSSCFVGYGRGSWSSRHLYPGCYDIDAGAGVHEIHTHTHSIHCVYLTS